MANRFKNFAGGKVRLMDSTTITFVSGAHSLPTNSSDFDTEDAFVVSIWRAKKYLTI